ncbi:MAG: hypothetical protein M1828_002338 [Chrysothrix sp. TS-e1954]|nr:MAG: hypothetical protein M1828_002338 [Chrysothrix sp. TS-e1954]
MTELSEQECLDIKTFPLEPTIGHLRKSLGSAPENPSATPPAINSPLEVDELDLCIRDAISALVIALAGHKVAKKLRSTETRGTVAGALASAFKRLDSDEADLKPFLTLAKLVAHRAPDVETWKAVLQLIADLARRTPPSSVPPSFGSTPRIFSSASQEGSEQTRRLVEPLLREELRDCSYVEVEGFFDKYFEKKKWTEKSKQIYKTVKDRIAFPDPPHEDAVWRWWSRFQDEHLSDTANVFYTTDSKGDLKGSDADSQLDLLVKHRDAPSSTPHDWSQVRVVGELTVSKPSNQKLYQLARLARIVFSTQPTRRFVHGFLLFGTLMQLHVFDRSGNYCAPHFDILLEPARFIQALVGYTLMDDDELGLDTFIEREGLRQFVTLKNEDSGKEERLELKTPPIAIQRAIVCRATCCYRTDKNRVVKFSWASDKRVPESDHLKRVKAVNGVARLVGHHQITSITELRGGLIFRKKRNIRSRPVDTPSSSFSGTRSLLQSISFNEGKRKSVDDEKGRLAKQPRSNSQTSKLSQEYRAEEGSQGTQTDAVETSEDKFRNRIYTCLAISPAGRPLDDFKNVPEFLRALRDAIKAHRSLFIDGKTLHRDISKNNIIITDPQKTSGFSGMLIDLDLATKVDKNGKNERSEAARMTGTLQFMAIEVLHAIERDVDHTYRHDLESFFYVFISICINCGWPARCTPKTNPLQSWYTGKYEDIAATKRGHMEQGGFEHIILPKFSPTFDCVKDLARALRDVIFYKGALYTGTPKKSPSMYNPMIRAFDDAIEKLQKYVPSGFFLDRILTADSGQESVNNGSIHSIHLTSNPLLKRRAFHEEVGVSKRRKLHERADCEWDSVNSADASRNELLTFVERAQRAVSSLFLKAKQVVLF